MTWPVPLLRNIVRPTWPSKLSAVCALLGAGLAFYAQMLADQKNNSGLALIVFAVAVGLYTLTAPTIVRERQADTKSPPLGIRSAYLVWACVFAVLAFASLKGNRFTPQGLLPWGLGVFLCFLALPPSKASRNMTAQPLRETALSILKRNRWCIPWTTCGVILAIVLATYLRFYHLPELPADLGWDLPYNYYDVQRILRGEHLVFFPENYGREGMFFYLVALVSQIIKLSPYSLRVTSAIIGIATVPAIYALARECADEETAAYAALLLAANKWHLVLTRSGYRVSLMPLFSILALYGLARGLRRGTSRDWAWGGLFVGLGVWTYKAFLFILPVVLACTFFYTLLNLRRSEQGGQDSNSVTPWGGSPSAMAKGTALLLFVAVVTAMPLIRFVFDSPQVYLARERLGIEIVNESLAQGISWSRNLARNAVTSALMFNVVGDGNSRFGVPFQRHLGLISGALFVLELGRAIARFRRGGHALLIIGLLGLTLPMTLSMAPGEMPNCFRSSGTIGPAVVLAALALRNLRGRIADLVDACPRSFDLRMQTLADSIWQRRNLRFDIRWTLAGILLVCALFWLEVRETSRFYFIDFKRFAPDNANYSVALQLAKSIIAYKDGPAYVKIWPYWYDGRALNVHLDAAGHSLAGELTEINLNKPPLAGFRGRILILLHPDDQDSLRTLRAFFTRQAIKQELYPNGEVALLAFYGER